MTNCNIHPCPREPPPQRRFTRRRAVSGGGEVAVLPGARARLQHATGTRIASYHWYTHCAAPAGTLACRRVRARVCVFMCLCVYVPVCLCLTLEHQHLKSSAEEVPVDNTANVLTYVTQVRACVRACVLVP